MDSAKKRRLTLDLDPPFQRRLKAIAGAQGRQHAPVLRNCYRPGVDEGRGRRSWKSIV